MTEALPMRPANDNDRFIMPYTGPQPSTIEGADQIAGDLIGTIELIDGRLMQLSCVMVDANKAPNFITELHWMPVPKESLS